MNSLFVNEISLRCGNNITDVNYFFCSRPRDAKKAKKQGGGEGKFFLMLLVTPKIEQTVSNPHLQTKNKKKKEMYHGKLLPICWKFWVFSKIFANKIFPAVLKNKETLVQINSFCTGSIKKPPPLNFRNPFCDWKISKV